MVFFFFPITLLLDAMLENEIFCNAFYGSDVMRYVKIKFFKPVFVCPSVIDRLFFAKFTL